ncbi:uncharacterized protein E0L32_005193 [Thyridium curvatum]|uniref:DUF4484 domain-containing protein n=1 Tax=Thyridium curvatum TaxID=1093900 RepID=A0A507BDG6_9PEZI|nr:uncharacterized protein E0L32_005193 [Thyridium curvatum]TPX14798.1 hypothetical protein E0L32_005193 [Thyridium curvatum]
MAASRRGQPPLSVRLPAGPNILPDLPPISALFLIDFDVKAGYTITWKRAVPGLELEGVVEYKSLPSGLHAVPDDLIYFVHDEGYAGLSAFVNKPTDDEESRHARMIAVGVLVPLSYGRLGRAWRHAEGLKEMVAQLVADKKQTKNLERYWETNGAKETPAQQQPSDSPLSSPSVTFAPSRPASGKGHTRKRSASDGTALIPPGHRLSPFHPAWSLTALLDTFGPLIFPIHRAALLRKRILISTHAPVHEACNFVYNISILANIPLSVLDLLETSAPAQRMRPLFTIGVHDIPFLLEDKAASKRRDSADTGMADDASSGWIACTTDSILASKDDLWDVLITMPPAHSANAKERVWPSVERPKGVVVKATQRDLRRFKTLKSGLARLSSGAALETNATSSEREPANTHRARPSTSSGLSTFASDDDDAVMIADASEKLIEPSTWAALAYSGFMWWASAGEQRRTEEAEESAHDALLLADLAPSMPQRSSIMSLSSGGALVDSVSSLTARRTTEGGADEAQDEEERAQTELAIIAYFHRLTTQLFSVLSDIVESSDEDDELEMSPAAAAGDGADSPEDSALLSDGGGGEDESDLLHPCRVRVDSDALNNMGLDVWSHEDAAFVRELTARYFLRRAYVEGKGVEVCGVRVC